MACTTACDSVSAVENAVPKRKLLLSSLASPVPANPRESSSRPQHPSDTRMGESVALEGAVWE
jgi:hypothetical protein